MMWMYVPTQIVRVGKENLKEDLSKDVLKQIAEALLDTVQCPVCLVALCPPVTLCTRGHGLCSFCKPTVQNCPTCREEFTDLHPTILHQLLDILPRDCQYKSLGCTEVYVPGGEHEKVCCYRTVDCKVLECEWSGQARRLQDHVLTTHVDLIVVMEAEAKINLSWDNFDVAENTFKYIPFIVDDQVIWAYFNMSIDVNKLCISFTQSSIGVSNCQYFAIVSFKSGNFEFTHTIRIPSDATLPGFDFLEDHCMMIPLSMVPRFVSQDSSLNYFVQVIKETK